MYLYAFKNNFQLVWILLKKNIVFQFALYIEIKDKIFLLASEQMELTNPRAINLFVQDALARHCINQLSRSFKVGPNQDEVYLHCVQKLKKVVKIVGSNVKFLNDPTSTAR